MASSFLCFGTTRSGTTFLYKHLRDHPQVWLPPQKELHYFSYQRDHGFANRKHLKHLRKLVPAARDAMHGKRGTTAELAWQARYLFGPRSDAWYRSLYDMTGPLVTGQIEPTYAVIGPDAVDSVHTMFPDVRLIYMMRDPIERAWSSVTKSTAKNKNRSMDEVTDADMFEKLDRSAIRMSTYIDHIERWERGFPEREILYGFYDEIVEDPSAFIARICAFIGIDAPTGTDAEEMRRPINDTTRFKVEIPPKIELYMAEKLVEPTRRLHDRFGGYTTGWYERMQRVVSS